MRLFRFGLISAMTLAALGCKEQDVGPTQAVIPPLAFVRYINGVPDTLNTTVRWVDQIEFTPMSFANVPFRGMGQGGYQGLEAGARRFKVFTYDPNLNSNTGSTGATTSELADTTFTFQAGKYYTLLHLGYARSGSTPRQRVYIIEDNLPAVSSTLSLRAIHAALGAPAVDVHATATATTSLTGSTPILTNVALTNGVTGISAYTSRAVGPFALQVAPAGTTTSVAAGTPTAGLSPSQSGADAVGGSGQGGTVMTGIVFPPTVYGSRAQAYSAAVGSSRIIDSAYAVTGGFELQDSLVTTGWVADQFAPTATQYHTITISAPPCPVSPAGVTRCATRPAAAVTARVTASGVRTLRTTESLAGYTGKVFEDTLILTSSPITTQVRQSRPRYSITRHFAGIVFFVDRHPPRVTP